MLFCLIENNCHDYYWCYISISYCAKTNFDLIFNVVRQAKVRYCMLLSNMRKKDYPIFGDYKRKGNQPNDLTSIMKAKTEIDICTHQILS